MENTPTSWPTRCNSYRKTNFINLFLTLYSAVTFKIVRLKLKNCLYLNSRVVGVLVGHEEGTSGSATVGVQSFTERRKKAFHSKKQKPLFINVQPHLPMEELVVDLHVLVVYGPVEGDGYHHWQLAQLQFTALHT